MNFIVYCCFNEKFKLILFQQQDKNQQQKNNSSPQQNQLIPSRNAEPKQRNITRVTGVIQTNFNHNPSEFAKKSTHVRFISYFCLLVLVFSCVIFCTSSSVCSSFYYFSYLLNFRLALQTENIVQKITQLK
jgi:hypothetical protein